jgi:pilus assembly protein Flp/PilA
MFPKTSSTQQLFSADTCVSHAECSGFQKISLIDVLAFRCFSPNSAKKKQDFPKAAEQAVTSSGNVSMIRCLKQFLCDQSGQTAVEYAVMLALILLGIIAGITSVGGGANGYWGRSVNQLNTHGF